MDEQNKMGLFVPYFKERVEQINKARWLWGTLGLFAITAYPIFQDAYGIWVNLIIFLAGCFFGTASAYDIITKRTS